MSIALTPNETWKYQLFADRRVVGNGPEGKPKRVLDPTKTVWTLRAISAAQQALIQNEISYRKDLYCPNAGTVILEQLRATLVSAENWLDAEGKPVSVTLGQDGRANDATIDRLSVDERTELANAGANRWKVPIGDWD